MSTVLNTERIELNMVIMFERLEMEVLDREWTGTAWEFTCERLDGYGRHVVAVSDYEQVEVLAESRERYLPC